MKCIFNIYFSIMLLNLTLTVIFICIIYSLFVQSLTKPLLCVMYIVIMRGVYRKISIKKSLLPDEKI